MDRIKDFLGLAENHSSFITDFEAAYQEKGEDLTSFIWYTKDGERTAERSEIIQTGKGEGTVQTWTTDAGKTIRITIYRNVKKMVPLIQVESFLLTLNINSTTKWKTG